MINRHLQIIHFSANQTCDSGPWPQSQQLPPPVATATAAAASVVQQTWPHRAGLLQGRHQKVSPFPRGCQLSGPFMPDGCRGSMWLSGQGLQASSPADNIQQPAAWCSLAEAGPQAQSRQLPAQSSLFPDSQAGIQQSCRLLCMLQLSAHAKGRGVMQAMELMESMSCMAAWQHGRMHCSDVPDVMDIIDVPDIRYSVLTSEAL